jgi:hypothetical protein
MASLGGGNPGDALNFDVSNDGKGGANVSLKGQHDTPPAPGGDVPAPGSGAAEKVAPDGKAAGKDATATPALDPERQRIVDQIVKRLPAKDQARARRELAKDFSAMTPEEIAPVKRFVDDPCSPENLKIGFGPEGKKYEDMARDACRKIAADGKGFGRAVYENIPKMMFIFLPLIAVVMYVLYLGSGRYYVEHLLFFVHFHAFFFLCGIAVLLLERLSTMFVATAAGPSLKAAEGILTAVLVFYVPYYLYRAMRRVYGQGRVVTLVKYSLLFVGYLVFMTLTVLGLLAYTALTL